MIIKQYLFSEISIARHYLFLRGHFLVFAGYCIAIIETMIAIRANLTSMTYGNAILITCCVLTLDLILVSIVYYNKRMFVWQELTIFSVHLIAYLFFYCWWIYCLEELRIIGLLNSLMAVTIVLSYTNVVQSIVMSTMSVICHLAMTYYAIEVSHQPGFLFVESFLTFCLFPAYFLIILAARSINIHRNKLEKTHKQLEAANRDLLGINSVMKRAQYLLDLEMDMAYNIQSSLFPSQPPDTKDWDIAFFSKPRYGVSGDFHDFYFTDDNLDGIALFDVSGHGLASALITILTKPILHRHFKNSAYNKLGRVVEATNADLKEQLEMVNIFITGILLRMKGDYIEYVNAGHPAMLYRQSESGRVHIVTDVYGKFKGCPVGIGSMTDHYKTLRFPMRRGDVLLLYSDCFIECMDTNGEQYGLEKLALSFSEAPLDTAKYVLDHVVESYNSFISDEKINDDLSVIVVRKK